MGLSRHGLLEIVSGALDPTKGAQMRMGMNGFGLCRRPEQFGDLFIAFLLRLLCKGKIFSIGL